MVAHVAQGDAAGELVDDEPLHGGDAAAHREAGPKLQHVHLETLVRIHVYVLSAASSASAW